MSSAEATPSPQPRQGRRAAVIVPVVVAIVALGVGVAAGWMLRGPGTSPAESERDEGAPPRLEAIARTLTEDLLARDFGAVRSRFDERMLAELTEPRLEAAFDQVAAAMGPVRSTTPKGETSDPPFWVFDRLVQAQSGSFVVRVALDAEGSVAGLFLLNPAVT